MVPAYPKCLLKACDWQLTLPLLLIPWLRPGDDKEDQVKKWWPMTLSVNVVNIMWWPTWLPLTSLWYPWNDQNATLNLVTSGDYRWWLLWWTGDDPVNFMMAYNDIWWQQLEIFITKVKRCVSCCQNDFLTKFSHFIPQFWKNFVVMDRMPSAAQELQDLGEA